jgi:hypothetical protein
MDDKLNLIPALDGFRYLCPIPAVNNFFNKKRSIFQPQAQCCYALSNKEMMVIDGYGDGEEKDLECRYCRRREITLRGECHLRDQDSECVSEMI